MASRVAVRSIVVTLLLVNCLVGTADAQNTQNRRTQQKPQQPPPPPPQFQVTEPTRTMGFSRLNIQVGETALIGKYGDPILCSPQLPVYGRHAFGGTSTPEYADAFNAEARAAGYRLTMKSNDLFADANSGSAELLVGAIIQNIQVKGCHLNNFPMRSHAEGTVTIEWQVFDPLEKKVLLKTTTVVSAKVTAPTDFMTTQVLRDAFQKAAKTVLSDPAFLAAVRDPNGKMPADSNALFPEATNAAAPAVPRIARLKPATAPFQTQVEALRQQVATVITGGGTGSAFYIADGLLLTNQHVVAGVQRLKIRFYGGREIPGEVVATNAKRDVALLKTESIGISGLPLRLDYPAVTSPVFVIGSPLGRENEGSVTSGIVSALRDEKDGPFIQSDVGVTNGNSGGPMFDERGNVIALTVSGVPGTAVNRFIPIADALRVLQIEFAEGASATNAGPSGQTSR